jgi:hypothetical protein
MTTGTRIGEFDLWREGYGGCTVTVYVAGTTTLADIFSDIECTDPLANPQTLDTRILDDLHQAFGRWEQPVYTTSTYSLSISNGEQTGIVAPPLTSMDGVDVSEAIVTPRSGEAEIALADLAERDIWAANYGPFSADALAADCTETLNTAIGVAAARGGGYVNLPAGSFPINPITLPEGVVLRGARRSATVLLSQTADAVAVLIDGDGAGLMDLILDGVIVPSGSYGVDAVNHVSIVFEDVEIRRFDTGLRLRGGTGFRWRNLSLTQCNNAGLLSGDLDASGDNLGAAFASLLWQGGSVAFNVETGLEIKAIDATASNVELAAVQFEANLGPSLIVTGGRDVRFRSCWWHENPQAVHIQDNTATPDLSINTTSRVEFVGGYFDGAGSDTEIDFDGQCDTVSFRNVDFRQAAFLLTSPEHAINLIDCQTDAACSSSGITQMLMRKSSDNGGMNSGVTSGATTVAAWTEEVPPGETWIMDAKVVAKQTNGTARGSWWVTGTVDRPAATLAYINLVTPFTLGSVLTGATSGASARIVGDSAGTLTLIDITGTFVNNEVITDADGGDARVSGSLSTTNAALSSAGNQNLKTVDESFTGTPTVLFAANGANAELQLTGVASADITWTFDNRVFKS